MTENQPAWKMSAMLKLCPKEIQDMVELRWDEIGDKSGVLSDRAATWGVVVVCVMF